MAEPRRVYTIAVLLGIASGGLMFFAAARTWASVRVAPTGMPVDVAKVTGTSAVPLVTAMAFVVMAGSVAVVAAAGRLRRAIGVIVVLAGAAAVVAVLVGGAGIDEALRDAVVSSTSMTGDTSDAETLVGTADHTWWRWVSLVGALPAVAIGALVVAQATRWPAMGRRYDAPSSARKVPAEPADRDLNDLWKSLDEGEDPTV